MINCDKCGICCRFCDKHPDLLHLDRGDGTCIHLQEDLSCAIYDTRPDICNTRTQYKLKYSSFLSEKKYIDFSEKACNYLKDKYGDKKDKPSS